MLPPEGPEAEELPLRLLNSISHNHIMQRSKRCTNLNIRYRSTEIEIRQWVLSEFQ